MTICLLICEECHKKYPDTDYVRIVPEYECKNIYAHSDLKLYEGEKDKK